MSARSNSEQHKNRNMRDFDQIDIIIPGNPGIDQFYDVFAQFLHEKRSGNTGLMVISHTNHLNPPHSGSTKRFSTLNEQITDKLAFIDDCKLRD